MIGHTNTALSARLEKFVDTVVVTERDLETTAVNHPSSSVKLVAEALRQVLAEHEVHNDARHRFEADNWRGTDFYMRFNAALVSRGSSLTGLIQTLPLPEKELYEESWTWGMRLRDLPPNFAPL